MNFTKSQKLKPRVHQLIPGGAHTYSKGDDQWPEFMAPYIARGKGCHVWDIDGNEYIEYGMGLRSVTLGHAYPPVIEAVRTQLADGCNFVRPAALELACAEKFLEMISGADMVKFAKNGSDATTGAIKLARASTGRDMVAICGDHPFFSVDDWFIGSTLINAGIPKAIQDLTVKFSYNSIESVEALFEQYPEQIACLILEAERWLPPKDDFLTKLKACCHKYGAVLIFDEIVTGFRWHNGGAQAYHGVTPDLSCFGKALGNGFSISALAGKRELMELGGLEHHKERVFLLSTTYGAESHSLAATMATMDVYQKEPVIETLYRQGRRLRDAVNPMIEEYNLQGHFELYGKDCCLFFATRDQEKKPSQPYRTLFLQECVKKGLLAPSLIVSYSHTDRDIDTTAEIIYEALAVYKKAIDEGYEKYLEGKSVKPVYRKEN